jgi:predicted ATP-grasp superfamily ATP-dependent carboligase
LKPDDLLILGGSLTALAVVRSAARLGIEPTILDVEPGPAFASRLPRRLFHDGWAREGCVDTMLAAAKGRRAWLVATTDAWIRVIANHRDRLEAAFDVVLHPANDALAICLGKACFADWCCAHDLPAPRRYRVEGDAPVAASAFPLLVRPDETLHSRSVPGIGKAREVRDDAELQTCLAAFRAAGVVPVACESLLDRPMVQYSVGVARINGASLAVVARKERPLPRACRVGTLVEAVSEPRVEALALRVADLLDYRGIAEVEVLVDASNGALFLIEVNARPWIQFGLGLAAGRDLLGFLVDAGRVTPVGSPRRARWISFPDDLYVCWARDDGLVRRGALKWSAYVRSVLGANVFGRWSLDDPGPFLQGLHELIVPRLRRLIERGFRKPRGG